MSLRAGFTALSLGFFTLGTCLAQQQPDSAFGIAPDAVTTGPQTGTQTTGTAEVDRFQRAPEPKRAEPGKVLPTEAGGLGGATSYTQTMPVDAESLAKMRLPFTNRPEFRAAWVTRFDWTVQREGKFDAEASKKRIIDSMENAKKLNLNAIIFQVRGDATTLYPSKLEPWSQRVGGKHPGFDPLQMAIDEAHKRGLEFHAYVNPIPCSEERTTEPANKAHVWYKHCLPDSKPNWLVFKDGKPAPFNEYKWFNPNLPEVQAHIRAAMIDIVRRYDIDGIHYDRIRFPSPDVSDDPWSKARYESGANPHELDYGPWQTENITRLLTDIYAQIMEIKPKVKVSASVWGIYDNTALPQSMNKAEGYSWTSSGLQDFMQDSVGWANAGCMDALVPMIYWSMGDLKPDYDELLLTFMTGIKNGRHVYGGQRVFSNEEMLRQVVATNLIGAHGMVPFTLGRISRPDTMEFYQNHIYPSPVKLPEMEWKAKPVYGHIIATVKDGGGTPVTDAQVKVHGKEFVALSATDGTCGILNIAPGEVKVTAELTDAGKAEATATVKAGKVARVELTLDE